MNNRLGGLTLAAALVFCLGIPAVSGHVIDPKASDADKANAKLRRDVEKQGAKHVTCLVKATTKCEADGSTSAVECHPNTGVVDYEPVPGKATAKFQDAIAKCDDKYAPSKKGNDYVGIGCPGDCNQSTPGVQQCATLSPDYEGTIESTTVISSIKARLPILALAIEVACSVDAGGTPTDPARQDCVTQNAATLGIYGKGLFKCAEKCENDFKDKKGNGGGTNGPNCLSKVAGRDPSFDICDDDVLAKAIDKEGALSPTNASLVLPQLRTAFNDATTDVYNRSDPTVVDPLTSTASPCGTCGNGTREGAEECDGGDDALCGVSCNANCTCNP